MGAARLQSVGRHCRLAEFGWWTEGAGLFEVLAGVHRPRDPCGAARVLYQLKADFAGPQLHLPGK